MTDRNLSKMGLQLQALQYSEATFSNICPNPILQHFNNAWISRGNEKDLGSVMLFTRINLEFFFNMKLSSSQTFLCKNKIVNLINLDIGCPAPFPMAADTDLT
jgi:hypothetical protein